LPQQPEPTAGAAPDSRLRTLSYLPPEPNPDGYAERHSRRTVDEAAAAARLPGVVFAALGGILLPARAGRMT
jgi:hypothetical protein